MTAPEPRLLEVGYVQRAHGLRGEVVVKLVTDRVDDRIHPGAVFLTDHGQLTVVASRPFQDRYIVVFEGVDDRVAADRLNRTVLRAEPIDDPDALWVHELIGSLVVEADGTEHGRVVAVHANPAHDILELEGGALVPVVFVVSCADGVTTVAPPTGLFDLYA